MQHVLRMRSGAALQAEHRLHEQRRFYEALLQEIIEIVEMRGVIAFELEARAGLRQRLQHEFDILEGVAEHDVLVLDVLAFPVVLERLEAVEHAEKTKIHRPHIERGDLRLVDRGGAHALVHRHGRRAAGGEVDHAVGALFYDF